MCDLCEGLDCRFLLFQILLLYAAGKLGGGGEGSYKRGGEGRELDALYCFRSDALEAKPATGMFSKYLLRTSPGAGVGEGSRAGRE